MTEAAGPDRVRSAEQIELSVREAAAAYRPAAVHPAAWCPGTLAAGRPRWSAWTSSSGRECAAPTWPGAG